MKRPHVVALHAALQGGVWENLNRAGLRLRFGGERGAGKSTVFTVGFQTLVGLKRADGVFGFGAVFAVRAVPRKRVAALYEKLLKRPHVVALHAALQDGSGCFFRRGCFCLGTVREDDDGVSLRARNENIAAAQIGALVGIAFLRQLDKFAGAQKNARFVWRSEAFHHDARVGQTHAHERGAVRFAGRCNSGGVEIHALREVVEREPLILVVANVRVLARRLHRAGDFFRLLRVFASQYAPALFVLIPRLGADLPAILVARAPAVRLAVFIDSCGAYLYRHDHISSSSSVASARPCS